jgi:hypothetical protein
MSSGGTVHRVRRALCPDRARRAEDDARADIDGVPAVSLNDTNARRATRARRVDRLRLLAARVCYAESWIIYGFHHLRRDPSRASCRESCNWPGGAPLDADATSACRGE